MKLKEFKKLNENWEKWSQPEVVANESEEPGADKTPAPNAGALASGAGGKQKSDVDTVLKQIQKINSPAEFAQMAQAMIQHGAKVKGGEAVLTRLYKALPKMIKGMKEEKLSEGRYHFANSFDELDIGEDPRAQAFEQCIKILNDLTYDSLEGEIASMADDAARALWKASEELDYKRNQVGNVEESKVGQALKSKFADAFRIGKEKKKDDKKKMVTPEQIKEWWAGLSAAEKLKFNSKLKLPSNIKKWGDQEYTNAAGYLLDNPVKEAVSPEQQEANEKAYSRCFEMGRKGVDVKTALRGGPVADFEACRAGHQDGANEFRQSLAERVRQTVVNKLQEKAKSKNQQQFMGMVKKCQDTGDCASDEVKKAADGMKKSDVKDFASTKHKGLPNKVEDKK